MRDRAARPGRQLAAPPAALCLSPHAPFHLRFLPVADPHHATPPCAASAVCTSPSSNNIARARSERERTRGRDAHAYSRDRKTPEQESSPARSSSALNTGKTQRTRSRGEAHSRVASQHAAHPAFGYARQMHCLSPPPPPDPAITAHTAPTLHPTKEIAQRFLSHRLHCSSCSRDPPAQIICACHMIMPQAVSSPARPSTTTTTRRP